MNYWLLAILCVVCYFIGNISFGRIVTKSQNKDIDITKKGSGNPGATNVFRNVSRKSGYITLLLDALKGVVSALIGLFVFGYGTIEGLIGLYACGLFAIVGHIFPVIFKFKGGKGAATMIGVFAVAHPLVMLVVFVLAFLFVWFFKYVSVASLLIVTVMVIYQNLILTEPNLVISFLTFAIFLLTWFAHRSNIERLLRGKETETNIKKKIFKDKKWQEKLDKKAEEKAEKVEFKHEKKEEKAEIKAEIKEAKAEIKQVKKQIKIVKKNSKQSRQKSSKYKTKKQNKKN